MPVFILLIGALIGGTASMSFKQGQENPNSHSLLDSHSSHVATSDYR